MYYDKVILVIAVKPSVKAYRMMLALMLHILLELDVFVFGCMTYIQDFMQKYERVFTCLNVNV